MATLRSQRSLARLRSRGARPQPVLIQTDVKTDSSVVDSDDLAPATFDVTASVPHLELEKIFPAILSPIALLRKVPDSQDSDALRALGPVFCNCLDAILHSMADLPEQMPTSPKYHTALKGVHFSKDMFLGHVNVVRAYYDERSDPERREAIQKAMQLLDVTMSSLKGFLHAVAYDAAQLKPLPQIPIEADVAPIADDSEASSSVSHSSAERQYQPDPGIGICASKSTETLSRTLKESKVSTFLKPLREKIKRRPSRLDVSVPAATNSSTTLVNSDSGPLNCGYVHVSVNIRNSLAQFPVFIDPNVGKVPHPDDATELWKDRNGLTQLASLKALVRYMTSPDVDNDVEIIDVFFLCFRFFSSPQETFEALLARYYEGESDSTARSHAMQVKVRVAKLLYLWVDLHWRAEDAEPVLSPLTQFTYTCLARDIPHEAASKLAESLLRRACDGDKSKGLRKERTIARAESKYRREILCSSWEPRGTKEMVNGDFSRVKLEHFHSPGGHAMLALQLTLVLWGKYRAFEPEDAVRYLMTRDGNDENPTSEVGRKVAEFMAFERALHRFVMSAIGTAESVQKRVELIEFFLEVAMRCHELRNYSASCLIVLACDRTTVLPFIAKLKLNPVHEQMRDTLRDFYAGQNRQMAAYKEALQSCSCPALPGMMLFIREVARGTGSEEYDQHPSVPGSRLINLKRYRPITWAVRAMERCHAPFRIQRVDYVCDWLEHVLSEYLVGTEVEWEERIRNDCRRL